MRRQKQLTIQQLRVIDAQTEEAALVLREATSRNGKRYRPYVEPSSLARARQGSRCNVLARMALLLRGMHHAGEPVENAEVLVAFVTGIVRELWGTGPESAAVVDLVHAEADAHEIVLRVHALLDPDVRPLHLRALERAVGAKMTLIARERRRQTERWRSPTTKGWAA